MNKRLIILLTAVVSIASIFAQDSRQRSNSTIIADALAQLPAQDEASFAAAIAFTPKSLIIKYLLKLMFCYDFNIYHC